MSFALREFLCLVFACAAAGVGCLCLVGSWLREVWLVRRRSGSVTAGVSLEVPRTGFASKVMRYAAVMTQRIECGMPTLLAEGRGGARAAGWLSVHARRAGIGEAVSVEGFREARLRMALGGAACGAFAGMLLSFELAIVLSLVGGSVGFCAMRGSVLSIERWRAAELERSLSEMLEVVALGLRSGLTFDRSLCLYGSHFDSSLAHACAKAQHRWALGLTTREEALRDFAESYGSPVLTRIVESTVRSLRFGSSLSASFEAAACEARAVHRAHIEEKVAKAPVKMMVPTGTLILPAMLLLVLGPVLLELMTGF